jgi:hypothetical protein
MRVISFAIFFKHLYLKIVRLFLSEKMTIYFFDENV